jgi:hypothetical protein
MRRYGLYDATRGLTLAIAAGLAGLLLYLASEVGQQTTARFWEEMGIVAAAGLVLALAPVLGGWTSGLVLRLSPGTFLLGFLPVLVAVGWILMASQPGSGWHEGTVVSWSHDVGLMGLIHSLALWHGVLAFGFGLALGSCLDSVPAPVAVPVAEPVAAEPVARPVAEPVAVAAPADEVVVDRTASDAPTVAEQREAALHSEPHLATVGPTTTTETTEE